MTSINAASLSVGLVRSLDHPLDHKASMDLTSFSDDGPGCGTPPPGFHPPRPHGLELTSHSSALDRVALNPQPLPPREILAALQPNVPGLLSHGGRFEAVALNPQPLPPREAVAEFRSASRIVEDEQCGTVPRWVHHLPPPPPPVDHNNPGSTRGIIIIGG